MVHHRGRRGILADPPRWVFGALRRPLVRARDHAALVRLPQEPAVPVVLRGHADPPHALARPAPLEPGSLEPSGYRSTDRLPARWVAMAERPGAPGVLGRAALRGGRAGVGWKARASPAPRRGGHPAGRIDRVGAAPGRVGAARSDRDRPPTRAARLRELALAVLDRRARLRPGTVPR